MGHAVERMNGISSALRCRLSEAEPTDSVDLEAPHRHLLLQNIAQDFVFEPQQARKGLFRRSR